MLTYASIVSIYKFYEVTVYITVKCRAAACVDLTATPRSTDAPEKNS